MVQTVATATEMKNNFGKYLNMVLQGEEVIVTKNGKEVARFVPRDASVSYLTDSLTGILSEQHDDSAVGNEKSKRLREKYASAD